MRKKPFLLASIALLLFSSVQAQERRSTNSAINAGAAGGIVSYTSTLSKASSVLARSSIAGTTGVKGTIGEGIASKVFLNNMLRETTTVR